MINEAPSLALRARPFPSCPDSALSMLVQGTEVTRIRWCKLRKTQRRQEVALSSFAADTLDVPEDLISHMSVCKLLLMSQAEINLPHSP